MRIVLLGDVMLGRLVDRRLAAAPPEYPWGDTLPLLRSADALMANLECVIADRGEPRPGKTFTFRSSAAHVAVLTAARVTAVSLANNHSMDYGPLALQDCLALLADHGIGSAGAGLSIEAARRPAEFGASGVRVACLAFTDNEPAWEAGPHPGTHYVPLDPGDPRFGRLLADIAETKRRSDVLVVSGHWGPNWGYAPLKEHVRAAHLFVDEGADVVCGHSPHVVRGIELYRGRPILYSCGDFIDDYAVDTVERNDEACVFCLDYDGTDLRRILVVPTMIARLRATLAQGIDRERIARTMQTLCARLNTECELIADGLRILPRRTHGDTSPS